jgi:hypothetical protein
LVARTLALPICHLILIVAIVVLAVRAATILAASSTILTPAKLTRASLAVDAILHRSVLSAIDSAIRQAADEIRTVSTHSTAANERRGLEVHNAIAIGAGHQLIQIGHLTGDHALVAAGKRARAAAGGHAANTALSEGPTGAAGAQSAEAARAGASAEAAAGHAQSAAAESTGSAAESATAAILRAGAFNRD